MVLDQPPTKHSHQSMGGKLKKKKIGERKNFADRRESQEKRPQQTERQLESRLSYKGERKGPR